MSEVIERLAKKIAVANNGGDWATHYNEDQKNVWRDRAKEVADMIVRECLEQVQKNFAGSVHTMASVHNTAVSNCRQSIKDHFGVE